MSDPILLETTGAIASIIFNRPERRNAITFAMWNDLQRVLIDLKDDPQVRVIVFRGAGHEAFSAGADISEFETHRNSAAKATLGDRLFILGHHYQRDEIIEFADARGDSYRPSVLAQQRPEGIRILRFLHRLRPFDAQEVGRGVRHHPFEQAGHLAFAKPPERLAIGTAQHLDPACARQHGTDDASVGHVVRTKHAEGIAMARRGLWLPTI